MGIMSLGITALFTGCGKKNREEILKTYDVV